MYLSIILLWLVRCVMGRPLPCTKVDGDNGAILCCEYQPLPHKESLTAMKAQSDHLLHSEKKCTLMIPKTSFGLMKEVWSLRNYTWATGMLQTKLPETKDIPRLEACCCEEKFVFSISDQGISANTGKTHKIVQLRQHVQPKLSLVCVRKEDCHNSGSIKVFQKMEAHKHYVESEDHPEYVHEELLLKPSGCLCVPPDTKTVKASAGEILIPMNYIEEAMTDSHIVKRNVDYHTELPEILRLALEIMREPNPLPVLNSIERQMALQLQQTRYFAAMAVASGLGGESRFGPDYSNTYLQNQQRNSTKADLESYQLILSAFLSGLALGQNFQNISQVEILDRLIVENGNTGIDLLETILELQNQSLPLDNHANEFDYNSRINSTNININSTYSYETEGIDYTTKVISSRLSSPAYVSTTKELSSQTYVSTLQELSSPTYMSTEANVTKSSGFYSPSFYSSFNIISNTTYVSSSATAVDKPKKTFIHSDKDGVPTYSTATAKFDTSTDASNDISSEEVDAIPSAVTDDSTTEADSIAQFSSQKVDFGSNDSMIFSTPDSMNFNNNDEYNTSVKEADFSTIFNEMTTPNKTTLSDSTTDVVYNSSENQSTSPVLDSHVFDDGASTDTPTVFDDSTEHGPSEDFSFYYDKAFTITPAVFDITTEHGSSHEDHSDYFDEEKFTKTPAVLDGTTEHGPSEDSSVYFAVESSTMIPAVIGDATEHNSSHQDYSVHLDKDDDFTTYDSAVSDEEIQHVHSVDYTMKSTPGPDGHIYNEEYTTDTADILERTEEFGNTEYNEDSTNIESIVSSSAEPDIQTTSNQDYSSDASESFGTTKHDITEELVVQTSFNDTDTTEPGSTTSKDEYITTTDSSTESESPEYKFNLREYIMSLPQFQPLTIDTDILMHIMFPPEPIGSNDERTANMK